MSGLFNSDLVARMAAYETYQRVRRGNSNITVSDISGGQVAPGLSAATATVSSEPQDSRAGTSTEQLHSTATAGFATATISPEERELFAPYATGANLYGASVTRQHLDPAPPVRSPPQPGGHGVGASDFDSFLNIGGPSSTIAGQPRVSSSHPQPSGGFSFPLREQLYRSRITAAAARQGGTRGAVRNRTRRQRFWNIPLVFLGDPEEDRRPEGRRLENLMAAGLGETVLTVGQDVGALAVRQAVRDNFLQDIVPSLTATTAFDPITVSFALFYVRRSGARTLLPVRRSLSASQIRALRVHTLYAQPSVIILPLGFNEDTVSEDEQQEQEAPESTAPVSECSPTAQEFRSFLVDLRTRFQIHTTIENQTVKVPQMSKVKATELLRFGSQIRPTVPPICYIEGEPGCDLGGITRGYISTVMKALSTQPIEDDLYILEGSDTSLTLASDETICERGVPRALANFIIFSVLNTDTGFVGLSRYTVRHMCSRGVSEAGSPEIDDISDPDDKAACLSLNSQLEEDSAELSDEDQEMINQCLEKFGSSSRYSKETAKELLEYIKYQSVVSCRRRALDMLRAAFQDSAAGLWITDHPNMHALLFPSYPEPDLDDFIAAFRYETANSRALTLLRRFADEHIRGGKKLSTLVELITAYPVLTPDALLIEVDISPRLFTVSTCDRKLVVTSLDYEVFKRNMNILIEEGLREGFTRA